MTWLIIFYTSGILMVMSPEEILHIAYEELVEIEPTTSIPELCLMDRVYPPMVPLDIVKIPLYAALLLKKSNMCKIRLPLYLQLENLKAAVDTEVEKVDEYSHIHPYFFPLAKELLECCYNTENIEESKVMVEKIREIRLAKTLKGIKCLDGRALNMNNITLFEFNEVKELIIGSTEVGRKIESLSKGQ
ncbi:GINS complex protein [Encephalitozoon hellem]|uniref:GINS complex protein n=1 Tax=Encephalitozoon hellem TaxID=27973 RepID=A0ABY8CJ46_ENCHE|nr:GINS complex protein [Encephalitozoon hellem]